MKISLLSLVFVLGATSARADDPPYQPVHLPACTVIKVPGIGEVCVYRTIEAWREVLRADADLTEAMAQLDAERARADAESVRAAALDGALTVRTATVAELERSLVAERAALKDRDRLYQRELHRPRWGSWLAWGTAAIATGVAVGFALR